MFKEAGKVLNNTVFTVLDGKAHLIKGIKWLAILTVTILLIAAVEAPGQAANAPKPLVTNVDPLEYGPASARAPIGENLTWPVRPGMHGDGSRAIPAIDDVIAAGGTRPGVALSSANDTSGVSRYIVVFKDPAPQASKASRDRLRDIVRGYGGSVIHEYSIINGMSVAMPDDRVNELYAAEDVSYIEKVQTVHTMLDDAVPRIGVDAVWDMGYYGTGIQVCVIDTGVDASHPDLDNGKVVAWVDYVNGETTPYDDNGHGTHVSSTIAGTGEASGGKYRGVAPNASLLEAKVLNRYGSGYMDDVIAGIDWGVRNGAGVISMSLGAGIHMQAVDDAVDRAVEHGVTVVIAAGNSGPDGMTVGCPGDARNAITVGAVERNDVIAAFSSRGPAWNGDIKPDVTNIGVDLVAARGSDSIIGTPLPDNAYYMALSGTSMATPMTAGVAALVLEANPGLTPAQVKEVLTNTARPAGDGTPNIDYGYGRVQAARAVEYALSGTVPQHPGEPTLPYYQPGVGWARTYGWDAGSDDWCFSAIPTADGGYAMAGTTNASGNYDVLLSALDNNGNATWSRTYGGPYGDEGYYLRQTADGGYVIAGLTHPDGTTHTAMYLVKTDGNGNLSWARTLGDGADSYANAVRQAADGGYVVAGVKRSAGGDLDAYLVKTDGNGTEQWNGTYGGSADDWAMDVWPTADGGYIVAGGTYSTGAADCDAYVFKVNGSGGQEWGYRYGDYLDDWANGLQKTADGGYIVAGGTCVRSTDTDAYLLKMDAMGLPEWNRSYGGPEYDEGICVRQTGDGGYVVAGGIGGNATSGLDVYLLKVDGAGSVLFSGEYGDSAREIGYSVELTADGGYLVGGTAYANGSGDAYLLKLSQEEPAPIGRVTGKVTSEGGKGISGVRMDIVDASDTGRVLYTRYTGRDGWFNFAAVNATGGLPAYVVYANASPYGYASSIPFGVAVGDVTLVNLTVPGYPDNVIVMANPANITAGGDTTRITAQVYCGDEKYHGAPLRVVFLTDLFYLNPNIIDSYTDADGCIEVTMTSLSMTGDIECYSFVVLDYSHGFNNTTIINITLDGLTGIVSDEYGCGVPDANVTLWNVTWDPEGGVWNNVDVLTLPGNPQQSVLSDQLPWSKANGTYTFYHVPEGTYNLTVEKAGYTNSSIVHIVRGANVVNLTLSHGNVAPVYDAVCVGDTIPDVMFYGTQYNVTITFMNTGNVPWRESDLVRMLAFGDTEALNATGDCDNHGCGYPEYAIAPGVNVMPGQSYTWNLTVAPQTLGHYLIGISMAQNGPGTGVTGFGSAAYQDVMIYPANLDRSLASAKVVDKSIPDTLILGRTYNASITFMNTGPQPWNESALVRMLAWGDTAELGISGDVYNFECGYEEFGLPAGKDVQPNETFTWNFTITPVAAGYTCIGLTMAQNIGIGYGYVYGFGDQDYESIIVTPASFDIAYGNAWYQGNTVPPVMMANQTYNVSVTYMNNGWAPWSEADSVRLLAFGDTAALGLAGDCDNYGSGYPEYAIQDGEYVLLWQPHTYNFTVTPTAPGTYMVGFAMVQNDGSTVTPFGGYGYARVMVDPQVDPGSGNCHEVRVTLVETAGNDIGNYTCSFSLVPQYGDRQAVATAYNTGDSLVFSGLNISYGDYDVVSNALDMYVQGSAIEVDAPVTNVSATCIFGGYYARPPETPSNDTCHELRITLHEPTDYYGFKESFALWKIDDRGMIYITDAYNNGSSLLFTDMNMPYGTYRIDHGGVNMSVSQLISVDAPVTNVTIDVSYTGPR